MDYIVVDNTEWTYPDRDFSSYLSGSGRLTGATARRPWRAAPPARTGTMHDHVSLPDNRQHL